MAIEELQWIWLAEMYSRIQQTFRCKDTYLQGNMANKTFSYLGKLFRVVFIVPKSLLHDFFFTILAQFLLSKHDFGRMYIYRILAKIAFEKNKSSYGRDLWLVTG